MQWREEGSYKNKNQREKGMIHIISSSKWYTIIRTRSSIIQFWRLAGEVRIRTVQQTYIVLV